MRTALSVLGGIALVLSGHALGQEGGVHHSGKLVKATPLIVAQSDGERREFRTRPGTFFTLKVDPKNGGSKHMTVIAEDMTPGDRIPTHRHPDADELIIIEAGTARVTLGDKVEVANAGAIVFVPQDTWIGVENIGKDHLISIGVMSSPGYEDYLRAISVPAGTPSTPLSKAELETIRKKYSQHAVYQ